MRSFSSINAFLAHLAAEALLGTSRQVHALDVASRIIQDEARHELGTYQSGAGPFGAWPELADATKEDRERLGFPANNPELRTGTLRDNIERVSTEYEAEVGVPDRVVGDGSRANPTRNIGDVAIAQEIGTDMIPPRSFLGHAAVVKEREVVEAIGLEIIYAVSGVRLNRL